VTVSEAERAPWMALLSGLIHGNRAGGDEAIRAAATALHVHAGRLTADWYDPLYAVLKEAGRQTLEEEMRFQDDQYKRALENHFICEGMRRVILPLAERHGAVEEELRGRLEDCDDAERLRALAVELAGAADRAAVEASLAALPPLGSSDG